MLHSNKAGQESKPKTLVEEVLSWSVYDILCRNRPSIKVETIPNEFQTCKHYKEAFRSAMLEEIFYEIDSAMVTMSEGIDLECYTTKPGSNTSNEFTVELCLPKGKKLPTKGDVMLVSARKLESRDQILKDNSFCTILVVTRVMDKHKFGKCSRVLMDVLLSKLPREGSESLYQVMHLTDLSTEAYSWEAMTNGFKDKSGIINLILSKSNNGSRLANMGERHKWTKAKEEYLFECFRDPKMKKHYKAGKTWFSAAVAGAINDHFGPGPPYVPVTCQKVYEKLKKYVNNGNVQLWVHPGASVPIFKSLVLNSLSYSLILGPEVHVQRKKKDSKWYKFAPNRRLIKK